MKAMIIKHPDTNLSYLIVPNSVSPGYGDVVRNEKYLVVTCKPKTTDVG